MSIEILETPFGERSKTLWPRRLKNEGPPPAEKAIFALLAQIGGSGTAAAICRAAEPENISQAAVHVLCKRLVKRGLLIREEIPVEIEGEQFTRIFYRTKTDIPNIDA